MKLQEFRFQSWEFDIKTKNRLNNLISRIVYFYYELSGESIELKDTNVLLVSIRKVSTKSNKENVGILGTKESGYIGGFEMVISEEELLKLEDKEKRIYLLTEFQRSLFAFLDNNEISFDKNFLKESFKKVVYKLDFWSPYSSIIISKNKKYACRLEARQCWGSEEFRLKFSDLKNETEEWFYIDKKDTIFFSEIYELNSSELMNSMVTTPMYFDKYKWKMNCFEFFWGEEKYIFNADTKTIEYRK